MTASTDKPIVIIDIVDVMMPADNAPSNYATRPDEDAPTGGAELRIVAPVLALRAEDQQLQHLAGCKWTSKNWSCPYDAVFMSLWSIYNQSSPGWREDWVGHSSHWNSPLSKDFDHLILLANTPLKADEEAECFSRYRDRFREQLSHVDSKSFPRQGQVSAAVSRILGHTFGRSGGPYIEQHLICPRCETLTETKIDTCFVTIGAKRKSNRRDFVSLAGIWEEFLKHHQTKPLRQAECHCGGQNEVKRLRMPDTPWIWFERNQNPPIGLSLTIRFGPLSQQLVYSLRAIIYSGGLHFTVRFREGLDGWWKHDGQIASGVPQPDNIQSETELLMNDERFAHILIYRRDDH